MNSIWFSLLWKEWCEQRWKLAVLTGISLGTPFAIVAILSYMGEVDLAESLLGISTAFLYAYALLAGMFVGMSTSAGENSRGTARFLGSMPTPAWTSALAKISIAMLVIALPIVILMICVWITMILQPSELVELAVRHNIRDFNLPWGIGNFFAARALAGVLGVSSLLLWTVACGVNRSDEVRAGAVAFLVIAVVWGCWVYAMELVSRNSLESIRSGLEVLRVMLPGGPATSSGNQPVEVILAGAGHLALLLWFLWRFGKVAATRHGGQGLQVSDLFRFKSGQAPRRTSLSSIAWKQFRETAPLALFAVVAVLAIAWLIYLADRNARRANQLGELLGGIGMSVGILVALVAGVGVLLEDYKPGVNNFWRSRPVNMHIWFAVKYLIGLIVVTIAFGSILLLANGLSGWQLGSYKEGGFIALVFVGCYSLSLCCYALVRQPIYAVILAMVTPYAGMMSLAFVQHLFGWGSISLEVSLAAILTGLGLVVLLAWQAVVRDWGWKQHR